VEVFVAEGVVDSVRELVGVTVEVSEGVGVEVEV